MLSLAVSVDASLIAAVMAARDPSSSLSARMRVAALFGVAQALMAGAGGLGGIFLQSLIESWDHWLVFFVLTVVAFQMGREALSDDTAANVRFGTSITLALALATSIDALAVGVTLPLLGTGLPLAVAVIGMVTFLLSLSAATVLSRLLATRRKPAGLIGAAILILLATSILLQHLRMQ